MCAERLYLGVELVLVLVTGFGIDNGRTGGVGCTWGK